MIELSATNTPIKNTTTPQSESNNAKILKMVKNDRMGGMVPSWEAPTTPKDHVQATLTGAGYIDQNPNALAYNAQQNTHNAAEFTFGDLVDMVNPLHHVPVVNHAYREITGDEIKPIGKIIGGGVYGGLLGAASGIVDAVIQHETGKDMADHVITAAFAEKEDKGQSQNTYKASESNATSQAEAFQSLTPREDITKLYFESEQATETGKTSSETATGLYALMDI